MWNANGWTKNVKFRGKISYFKSKLGGSVTAPNDNCKQKYGFSPSFLRKTI